MSRISPARLLLVALAAGALPAVASAQAPRPDTVRLRVNWVPGSTAEVDHHRFRSQTQGEAVDSASSAWRADLRVRGTGARRDIELVGLRREDDSTQVPIPKSDSALVALTIDRTGHIQAVRGGAALGERLATTLDSAIARLGANAPGLRQGLSVLRSPGFLDQAIQGHYTNAAGFWLGADLVVGSRYELKSSRPVPVFPGVVLPTVLSFGVSGRQRCHDGAVDTSCVKLVLTEQPNLDSLRAVLRRAMGMSVGEAADLVVIKESTMHRRIELVVEPWTLTPYYLYESNEFVFVVGAEGEEDVTITNTEREQTWFGWERVLPESHVAARDGDARRIADLLRDSTPVDELDQQGTTPLYRAASSGRKAVITALVNAKADVGAAERIALRRGDIAALKELRAIPRQRTAPKPDAAAALAAIAEREYDKALPHLTEAALAESTPGAAHATLAEILVRDRQDSAGVAIAERVLQVRPCEASAARALRRAHDPYYSRWKERDFAKAVSDAARLVRCAPNSGEAWFAQAWLAAREADDSTEANALRRLGTVPYFSGEQLAFGRWLLESLAPRTILVVDGDLDFVTLRQLQAEGVRTDVVVVDESAMERAANLRHLRDRHALPLPFNDQRLDSLDKAGEYWGADVVNHWRTLSRSGRLDRGLAIGGNVGGDDYEGPGAFWGNGAVLVLGDTALASVPRPAAILAQVRKGERIAGPPTLPDDPDPARRRYDLANDVVSGGMLYLNALSLAELDLDAAQLGAADSLIALLTRRAGTLEASTRDEHFASLAASRRELRSAAFTRGDRAEARRQADATRQLEPEEWAPLASLGTSALLVARPAEAIAWYTRALEKGEEFDLLLLAGVAMRLGGRADSSIALLAGAQHELDAIPESQRDVRPTSRYVHLPVTPADTVGVVEMYAPRSQFEVRAMLKYQVAISHALRGDLAAADTAWNAAKLIAPNEALRCYVHNQLLATRLMAKPDPRADGWISQQVAALACPARR